MGELDGKVAVITGAGSGMGKASAKVFMREGALGVIATDISGAEDDTAKELGDGVVPVHCDVTKEEDVVAAIDAAVQEFGRIDAVLNVAGIGVGMAMLDVTQKDYDRVLDIMLRGVFFGTTHGIRAMQKVGAGGSIVNWASLAALNATPGTSIYSAAKAGVVSLTKSAAVEHGHEGIRTNAICPGYILSEGMGAGLARMKDHLTPKIPMQRLGEPIEVAELGAFLSSERAAYINGAVITVDGGYGVRFA
jgi:NAD(P)-dependent dehydrogenase (short-subunit alcohol dehydrogenase family)